MVSISMQNCRANTEGTHLQPFTAQRCRSAAEKIYFRGSFQFSIVTIETISPLWKPEILLLRHFPKLGIAYFNGKNHSNIS